MDQQFIKVSFSISYIVEKRKEGRAVAAVMADVNDAALKKELGNYISVENAPDASYGDVPSFLQDSVLGPKRGC